MGLKPIVERRKYKISTVVVWSRFRSGPSGRIRVVQQGWSHRNGSCAERQNSAAKNASGNHLANVTRLEEYLRDEREHAGEKMVGT